MAIAELVMPKMGESIMEATVLKWHKKVGDHVKQDETVLEIATDKVDSEVPSTAEGIITEILFKENDVVPIGTVIARVETNVGAATSATQSAPAPVQETRTQDQPSMAAPQPDQSVEEMPYVPQASQSIAPKAGGGNNKFYSPLVLNIANSEGIALSELENIPGTGNEGRVTKRDILQYVVDKKGGKVSSQQAAVSSQPAQPQQQVQQPTQHAGTWGVETEAGGKKEEVSSQPSAISNQQSQPQVQQQASGTQPASTSASTYPTGNVEIIEMDRMRKLIANHMVNSKHTSPHVTSFVEADVTNMVMWRDRVKKNFEKSEGTKITFTPLFIECLVRVIKRHPMVNASVDADRIIIKKDINIGMATALPSGNLIVPVIRNADQLNLVGLSKAVNTLAENARGGKLKPDDTANGTFTLTNVGTFGSLMGTPIINQPQVAILAVGAIKKRPVVIETPEGDTIGIRHMMYLSMSYDHRIVDGSLGAMFLTEVAKEFEKWDSNRDWI
jgi:2-oxoglutarate dehydrogenase E2 component (dihydrolipoamide succinyltransferase)